MVMQVELVSPERILFSGEATMVTCRTDSCDIAFLTGHAPYLGTLQIHQVKIIMSDESVEMAAVHGGLVEVSNNRVIMLSDLAELREDIDVQRAQRAKEAAERQLMDSDDAAVEAALRRAHVRLVVAGVEAAAH